MDLNILQTLERYLGKSKYKIKCSNHYQCQLSDHKINNKLLRADQIYSQIYLCTRTLYCQRQKLVKSYQIIYEKCLIFDYLLKLKKSKKICSSF